MLSSPGRSKTTTPCLRVAPEQISSLLVSFLLLRYFCEPTDYGCMPSSIQWHTDHPEGKHFSEAVTDRTWRFLSKSGYVSSSLPKTLFVSSKMVYKQYNIKKIGSIQHGIQLVSEIVEHVPDVIQNVTCCSHSVNSTVTRKRKGNTNISHTYMWSLFINISKNQMDLLWYYFAVI